MNDEPEKKRNLTDEDVEALIDELESRLEKQVGRGLISLVWKAAILALLAIAVWGMAKGENFL